MADLNGLRIADRKHIGLAEMLKGGVIMDVTNAEQAKIAEDAGAASVMALERVPSDIRRDGGVARMSPVKKIQESQKAVTIPVMAKARIGHFVEAQILEALAVDYIDESEGLTPADGHFHIDKFAFRIPLGPRALGGKAGKPPRPNLPRGRHRPPRRRRAHDAARRGGRVRRLRPLQ